MLLSNEDIERFEKRGYVKDSFVKFDQQGYATLRNVSGNCFFFDAEKVTCKERGNRPLGCRIYPVMLDENKGIVVDDVCPGAHSFTEKQKGKRGKKVVKLLARIDEEAKNRRLGKP
jgi:Fe-S-cluster containining protein